MGKKNENEKKSETVHEEQQFYFDYGQRPFRVAMRVEPNETSGGLTFYVKALEETASVDLGEAFAITKNLNDPCIRKNMAYVGVNDLRKSATSFLEKYGLAKNTGVVKTSGYVEYPLYEFDLEKLKELGLL